MIDEWIGVLTKPEETMAAEKKKADLGQAVINFAIAGLIVGLVLGIIIALIPFLIQPILETSSEIPLETIEALETLAAVGPIAIVVLPILGIIAAIVCSLVGNLFWWIAAKIVEGNGSFSLQYYLFSLIAVPTALAYTILYLIAIILGIIPIIGPVISMIIIAIAAGFLSIVLFMAYIAAVKETHGFTTLQVALTTGIAYAIMLLAIIVIAVVVGVIIIIAVGPELIRQIELTL